LSRWNVQGCANCQTHLETEAFFGLQRLSKALVEDAIEANAIDIEVRTRDGLLKAAEPRALGLFASKPFRFEVR
jgi:tyrosinase